MSKKCCFIGHRKIQVTDALVEKLDACIKVLIEERGVDCFLFGGRSQFDDLCHERITKMQERYPHIKRIAFTCKSEYACKKDEKEELEHITCAVTKRNIKYKDYDEVEESERVFNAGKAAYVERNQEMINASDFSISLKEANEYVAKNHRHHNPVVGDKYRVGVEKDGKLCGVAHVGRPLSRYLDDGKTVEVLRVCTDGTKNACSFLYARCARVAKELGYKKIITYILEEETGVSLKASGWTLVNDSCGGGSWNCKSRPRITQEIVQVDLLGKKRIIRKAVPTCKKQRWEKIL